VSKSTFKRRLHQSKYRCFTTIDKPQQQEDQIKVSHKTSKKDVQFWNNLVWINETKINLYQNDGKRRIWRREGTAHHLKHTNSSVKHGGGGVMEKGRNCSSSEAY
jgi:hypothetical protein